MTTTRHPVVVSHDDASAFTTGLRSFFAYRDLGIRHVTGGRVGEGAGEVLLKAGSSVYQPPGIRHREVAHSEDLELLEITLPAGFETATAEAP